MSLRFEITLTVEIDETAHFLEVDEDNQLDVVEEKVSDCLYDLDDLKILDIDVMRRLE
jgi:hypothetical protein|tara:strand:- start:306 stop:479 length:174 start_codon:yes stop_codon:yes gene_type:complete